MTDLKHFLIVQLSYQCKLCGHIGLGTTEQRFKHYDTHTKSLPFTVDAINALFQA